jgi:diguanylate cyclase
VGGLQVDDELEVLARRLLDVLGRLTGLESTYLTRIRLDEGLQEVVVARNVGERALVPEGLVVPWEDTLCKRAMDEGRWCTSDVPTLWGDSAAAAALGLRTYVSVPVADAAGGLYGTLCGASQRQVELDEDVHALLEVLGEMVTLQLQQRAALAAMDVLAATDPLTGLANRRHLDDELRRRAAHDRRGGKPRGVWRYGLGGSR